MKNSDIIYLSWLNIRRNIGKSIIFVLVLFFLFMILSIALNYQYSMSNYANNYVNNSLHARTLFVFNVDKVNDKEFLDGLYSYEHIDFAYSINKLSKDIRLQDFPNDGDEKIISLLPIGGNLKLNIVYGHDIQDDYDIICPTEMIFSDFYDEIHLDDTKDELVDMRPFVAHEYNFKYDKYAMEDENATSLYLDKTFDAKLRIVGLFNDEISESKQYNCYINIDTLDKIVNESWTEYLGEFSSITEEIDVTYRVIVDSPLNLEKVQKQLLDDGYDNVLLGYDTDFTAFKIINLVCFSVMFIVVVLTIITFYVFTKKNINYYKYDIGLYKTFGYKNKIIKKIIFIQELILIVISYILCVILSLLLMIFINSYISNYFDYTWLKIMISPLYMIGLFIISLILLWVIVHKMGKRINSIEAKEILNENNI